MGGAGPIKVVSTKTGLSMDTKPKISLVSTKPHYFVDTKFPNGISSYPDERGKRESIKDCGKAVILEIWELPAL